MKHDIRLTENAVCYQGFFQLNRLILSHSLFQGGISKSISREVFKRRPAVVVFLYDQRAEAIVLVEQFRAGAAEQAITSNKPESAWLIEPVAGIIDTDESALEAARREAEEETGLVVHSFEYVCNFYPSPGSCDEILHLYAAEIDSTQIKPFAGMVEEGEDIRVVTMSFSEAKAKLKKAEFNVASTFIGMQWLFYQKLA